MSESRFASLQEALIGAGVAASHARRAAREIECHFHALVDAECARGTRPEDARRAAHLVLGADGALLQEYLARPELRSWAARHQALCFGLLPLLCFVAACAASFVLGALLHACLATYLHHVQIRPGVTMLIDRLMRALVLWVFPALVCAAFATLAYRQRVPLRWPLLGCGLLCSLAGFMNLEVMLYGGPELGYAKGGIGISPETIAGQAVHAITLLALVLAPLRVFTQRLKRRLHAC